MRLKPLILPLAALILAGCHHRDHGLVNPNEPTTENHSEDDYCYAKIQLFFPGNEVSDSRAGNDSFDYGLAAENEIKNAILVLFDLEDGNFTDALIKFRKAYNLDLSGFINTSSPSAVKTIKILKDDFSGPKTPFAMVIANHNGLFEVTSQNGLKFNGEIVSNNKSVKDLRDEWCIQSPNQFTANGLLMVNTLGFNVKAGNTIKLAHYITATPFASTRTYPTEAEALYGDIAFSAYLERAVAKVCVMNSVGTDATVSATGSVKTDLTYDVIGWKLINQNNSSYILRQWQNIDVADDNWGTYKSSDSNASSYRFIKDTEGIELDVFDYYNFSQFSKSYGYGEDLSNAYHTTQFGQFGKDNPAYCYENTFPVDKMMLKNATCVLVKTQFKKDGSASDFYRVGEDYNNYYDETEVKAYLCANIPNQYSASSIFPGMEGTLSCENVSFDASITCGHAPISAITFKLTKADSSTETVNWTAQDNADELATLNANNDVFLYNEGYAYYIVPIKHFGDDLTPWNSHESTTPAYGKDIESAYHISNANSSPNYLGRYGVVRNNSYSITLRSVKHLGLANDCSISTSDAKNPYIGTDETPLDYLESNIKAEISILNWTDREESVDLEVK